MPVGLDGLVRPALFTNFSTGTPAVPLDTTQNNIMGIWNLTGVQYFEKIKNLTNLPKDFSSIAAGSCFVLSNASIADFAPNAPNTSVVGFKNIWMSINTNTSVSRICPAPISCCWSGPLNYDWSLPILWAECITMSPWTLKSHSAKIVLPRQGFVSPLWEARMLSCSPSFHYIHVTTAKVTNLADIVKTLNATMRLF